MDTQKRRVSDLTDEQLLLLFQETIQAEIEKNLKNGNPVARYDLKTRRAYKEYPDGRREYA